MRPSEDLYFLRMAHLVATRSTCARRQVGCILVDNRGHVKATGRNGVSYGATHCTDKPCPGASLASGQGLSICQAIHAEANALLQCADVWSLKTAYCTTAPCIDCVKLLANTSIERIVFSEEYPHPEAKEFWESVRPGIEGAWLLVPRVLPFCIG